MASAVEQRDDEIDRLQLIIKQLQRARFGRRSERIDPNQIALGLEDLETDEARAEARPEPPAKAKNRKNRKSGRKPLPDNLPREEVRVDVSTTVCACGGALHPIGESVSEMLDWVPAKFRVIRICRPKYGCRACGTVSQAPAPERPIAGGLATPALLAQVLVSKYCDHTPLYRQSQIYARLGIDERLIKVEYVHVLSPYSAQPQQTCELCGPQMPFSRPYFVGVVSILRTPCHHVRMPPLRAVLPPDAIAFRSCAHCLGALNSFRQRFWSDSLARIAYEHSPRVTLGH